VLSVLCVLAFNNTSEFPFRTLSLGWSRSMQPVTSKFFDSPAGSDAAERGREDAAGQLGPAPPRARGHAGEAEDPASAGRSQGSNVGSADRHGGLDRFAYIPRAAPGGAKAAGLDDTLRRDENSSPLSTAVTRFTSPLVRAGSFSAGGARLSVRPQLPSTRPRAVSVQPVRLDLLAFRRS
jgi:hypothetical protein